MQDTAPEAKSPLSRLPSLLALAHFLLIATLIVGWLYTLEGSDETMQAPFLPSVMQVVRVVDFPSSQIANSLVAAVLLSQRPLVLQVLEGHRMRDIYLAAYWMPLLTIGSLQWWVLGVAIRKGARVSAGQ